MIAKFECPNFKIEGEVEVVKQIVNLIAPNTSPSPSSLPELKEGEKYAGIVLDEETGLPLYHLILLPGEAEPLEWQQAMDWAKAQGGELPTRREQSLLFANARKQFKAAWHWSSEQCSSGGAWAQGFFSGVQGSLCKASSSRARAVRSVVVTN